MVQYTKTQVHSFILSLCIFLFLSRFPSLIAQSAPADTTKPGFYLLLRREDFLHTMVTKEKYLLSLTNSVASEMASRRSEGITLSDLGIQEVVPPEDVLLSEYEREMQYIVQLLDEIEILEREARKYVDFQVLEALSRVKIQVRQLIESSSFSAEMTAGAPKAVSDTGDEAGTKEEDNSGIGNANSILDLFEQWKYNRILEYKIKLTEYLFIRTRLLKSATPQQELRMFRRDLENALGNYAAGDLVLSRLQLNDLFDTFSNNRILDDVLYYASESAYGLNYLDEALNGYQKLVRKYPQSSFAARALVKMIYIYYIYDDFQKLSQTYSRLTGHAALDDEVMGTVSYLVGYAHFEIGAYADGIKALKNVAPKSTYFYPALYLSAACYSNIGQDDVAMNVYQNLVQRKVSDPNREVLSQIKNNALLKLGLISYEKGEPQKAIAYFNQVSENFKYYDLSLIGKAWSAYRSGRPGEALRNAEWLLRHSMLSSYAYEARVLAASSKQLLGHSEEAIYDLKQVFQVGLQAEQMESLSPEQKITLQSIQDIEKYQEKTFSERDLDMIKEIEQIRSFLQGTIPAPDTAQESELSDKLTEKIDMLDRLEGQARIKGDEETLNQIRRVRSGLIQTLEDHSLRSVGGRTAGIDDPLVQQMGVSEYFRYAFNSLLFGTLREKEQTRKNIKEAEELLGSAQATDQFDLALRMEVSQEELEDYYGRLNQYEIWLRENAPQEFRIDIDRWATFSGYGISNINFSRIKEKDRRIADISARIEILDRVFQAKRGALESRIQGLLKDVSLIEEQMRQEYERREEAERDKFFEKEYFDKRNQETSGGKLREKPETGTEKVKK